MGELSPLAYPWQATVGRELDTSSCPGFYARTGLDAGGKARFKFPNTTLEITERVWTYHRGEKEACFSTATLLGAKVRPASAELHSYSTPEYNAHTQRIFKRHRKLYMLRSMVMGSCTQRSRVIDAPLELLSFEQHCQPR